MQPYKFLPQLKPVLWGGHRLTALKRDFMHNAQCTVPASDEPIGESWEISAMPGHESVVATGPEAGTTLQQLLARHGERLVGHDCFKRYGEHFPLLIKLIDAHKPLSVQVHPDDALAEQRHHCPGKTEMWYIMQTEPQACILAGLKRTLPLDRLDELAHNGELIDWMDCHQSRPGDVFFLPAGTLHSIGAGNLLAEIQQASDVTYRLYDYGRLDANGQPRQLHLQQAREAIDCQPNPDIASHCLPESKGTTPLVRCEYFDVAHLGIDGHLAPNWEPMRSFMIVVCTQGQYTLVTDDDCRTTLAMGESALVPADVNTIHIEGNGQAITAQMPTTTYPK